MLRHVIIWATARHESARRDISWNMTCPVRRDETRNMLGYITYEMCEETLEQTSNRDARRHRKERNNAKTIFQTNGKGTYKIKDLHETSSSGN